MVVARMLMRCQTSLQEHFKRDCEKSGVNLDKPSVLGMSTRTFPMKVFGKWFFFPFKDQIDAILMENMKSKVNIENVANTLRNNALLEEVQAERKQSPQNKGKDEEVKLDVQAERKPLSSKNSWGHWFDSSFEDDGNDYKTSKQGKDKGKEKFRHDTGKTNKDSEEAITETQLPKTQSGKQY